MFLMAELGGSRARLRRDVIFGRSDNTLRKGIKVRFQTIERCREAYPINMMCCLLKVHPKKGRLALPNGCGDLFCGRVVG
jgi:hypothetical protein